MTCNNGHLIVKRRRIVVAKLSQLFELQRFAGNKDLDNIINDTHSRYDNSNIIELCDDELELVAAGMNGGGMGERTCEAMCPKCNTITTFQCYSGGRAVCLKCGEKIIL